MPYSPKKTVTLTKVNYCQSLLSDRISFRRIKLLADFERSLGLILFFDFRRL
jgi:hypothetical protein